MLNLLFQFLLENILHIYLLVYVTYNYFHRN